MLVTLINYMSFRIKYKERIIMRPIVVNNMYPSDADIYCVNFAWK